jgi:hypothetical protein
MNRTKKLIATLLAAVVLGLGTAAQAQDTPPPSEPPPPSPPAARHSSSSVGGDGAGIGIGMAFSLSGVATGLFVYDMAIWHIEGLLGFSSTSNPGGADRSTGISFGAGGWYHLHRGSASDFSLGAALLVDTTSNPGGNSTTVTSFEPGAQIRAFVTPNVSLNARVGLALMFGDTGGGGTDLILNGLPVAFFGASYFFR